MRLSPKEKKRMFDYNYKKARENIKFGEPPITNSQKRQSSVGKGDFNRITNTKQYEENYSKIKWNSKKDRKNGQ